MLRDRAQAVACLVGLGALAACGSSATSGGGTAPSSAAATGAPAATSTPAAQAAGSAGPVTVALKHVPQGTATLTYNAGAKTLTVEIKLVGLAPSSSHPAHIHAGSCARQGNVAYPLDAVIANAVGVADSTTSVSNVKEAGIPDGAWYVNVHNGPGLSPDVQFQPLVCGDVANPSKAASVTVQLLEGPTPPPGSVDQTATGSATLSIVGGALRVVVSVTGLAPNGSHAAHIHSGSCESQGAVVYPLSALVADASGKATSTTTVANVSSIPSGKWYVNVHRSTTLTTQTDFDPILCGDVMPGS